MSLGWQDLYDQLREMLCAQGIKIEYRQQGIVTKDDLEAMSDPNGGQTMIIIDDNSTTASENKDVVDAFTKARHNNCSIVLLLHFIFGSQNLAKIRGNTGYYFLLKSCENSQQVALLGSKMGMKSVLVQAYEQEARKPYGYVLIDRRTVTPYQHRIRRNIFEELEEKEQPPPQPVSEDFGKEEQKTPPPAVEKKQRPWLERNTSKNYREKKKKPRKRKSQPKKKIEEEPLRYIRIEEEQPISYLNKPEKQPLLTKVDNRPVITIRKRNKYY